ncbi:MAG: stage III sporulation protein AA [Defluviitaleaceae bacterium]|nr:stage III sporulation protein AA [Defluviitaleaceae bacterium]
MEIADVLKEYAHGGLVRAFDHVAPHILESAREMRIRQGLPIIVRTLSDEVVLAYKPTMADIAGTLAKMANHSLYAYDAEIKNGFISLVGGHRVGICGRAVVEGGKIKTLRHISGLTIRIARQVIGAGDAVLPFVAVKGQGRPNNTLIISPPGQGKTTVLRDLVRILSNKKLHVAVVDERSEIGGTQLGITQNDLGIRTDVLDGAPKAEGMLLVLRAMSPDVIAVDEIGGDEDVKALLAVSSCGAKIIATLHGENMADLQRKQSLAPLLTNGIFDRYIFLTDKPKPATLRAVYDKDFREIKLC